jgi:hypothetical protein
MNDQSQADGVWQNGESDLAVFLVKAAACGGKIKSRARDFAYGSFHEPATGELNRIEIDHTKTLAGQRLNE